MTNVVTDIHDIKGLVPVPHGWLWQSSLLLLFLLMLLFVWWQKRRQPAGLSVSVTPLPTPQEIAFAALRRLREENLPVEEFYTRLSGVVRKFLEGQYALRAPERTTEEFLLEMSQGNALKPQYRELLGVFLQEADLVKFARHRPGAEARQLAFAAAENFVRESVG